MLRAAAVCDADGWASLGNPAVKVLDPKQYHSMHDLQLLGVSGDLVSSYISIITPQLGPFFRVHKSLLITHLLSPLTLQVWHPRKLQVSASWDFRVVLMIWEPATRQRAKSL